MAHKITYDMLAAQVARTTAALPSVDWNDQAPSARRARATWGPHSQGVPLVHAPRWRSDHHAWVVEGTQGAGAIRYAGNEVEEVSA